MATVEFAELGAELAPDQSAVFGFPHWGLVRRCALGLYALALVAYTYAYGVPVQRELVIVWTCGGLLCAALGRPPREVLQLFLDWLPIALVLAVYDFTRGSADSIGIPVHYHPMIDFDKFVFFGEAPTEWLQAHLYEPGVVHWYEVGFTLVYTSYFIVPFAVAGILWARDRFAFLRFSKRLVTLAFAGLATYVAFPAAPPWMAGEMGYLNGIHRLTSDGWKVVDLKTAALFSHGQESVNTVAAVPSLHAGFTALVAFFLWSRVARRWRPLLLLYPLAMGLTLMATGEHYFFDVCLGWCYAGAVMAGWALWERRRSALRIAQPART